MSGDEEDYFVPLEDQRVFGAGIKRKRISFVPASVQQTSISNPLTLANNTGDKYLSIVLGQADAVAQPKSTGRLTGKESNGDTVAMVCPICKQPLDKSDKVGISSHETSIAHQVCLEHSDPPSHLDRDRVGLKYLSGFGWDPDSRKGLGVRQEGIRIPIKAKEKNDTAGLGLGTVDEDDARVTKRKLQPKKTTITRLNAKETRQMEIDKNKHAQRLRQSFYGEDFSQYLGPNG